MAIRGVLFDLDETLVDRAQSLAQFTEELFEAFGGGLDDVAPDRAVHVMRKADRGGYRERRAFFQDVVAELEWRDPPELDDLLVFWGTTFPKCTVPTAGAFEVLEALRKRGMPVGLITNGGVAFQNAKIDRIDLREWLDVVVISEAAGVEKPDPRIFRLALDEIGLSAEETAFVGDHPVNDISGASEMGMTTVWMRGDAEWPEALEPPDHTIDALGDLMAALDGMAMLRG